jgi:hypothetical protein
MRERLLWQKRPSFRGRALKLIFIKLPDTLIIHKTPSKFAPYGYEFKLCAQAIFQVFFKTNFLDSKIYFSK